MQKQSKPSRREKLVDDIAAAHAKGVGTLAVCRVVGCGDMTQLPLGFGDVRVGDVVPMMLGRVSELEAELEADRATLDDTREELSSWRERAERAERIVNRSMS